MRILLLTLALVLPAAPFCHGAEAVRPRETTEAASNGYVGRTVSPFEGVTTDGEKISYPSHGARVLIIDLWGLGCASCLEEMRFLEPIYRQFRDQGLRIWAVNTEDIEAPEILEGLEKRGFDLSYDLVPDPGLEITKLFTSWFIPVTVIVDSEGVVQYYKVGFNRSDAEAIRAKVGALLAQ